MGANPPPAILVRSGDMAEAVRAATLLSAMTANLNAETERLAHDIEELVGDPGLDRRGAASGLSDAVASLTKREGAPVRAGRRAQGVPVVGRGGARLAAEAGRRPRQPGRDAQGPDRPDRRRGGAAQGAGAVGARGRRACGARDRGEGGESAGRSACSAAPGGRLLRRQGAACRFPVAGTILKAFGSSDGLGGTEHGILVATLAGAVVSAPADGSVLYSGPYRSYGRLLIIDAGEGYYVLLGGYGAHLRLARRSRPLRRAGRRGGRRVDRRWRPPRQLALASPFSISN